MCAQVYTSQPINSRVSALGVNFTRADLEFHGVDHSGASFEARVFFNNPNADESTPKTAANGYAGSFYVFGHGGCFGDVGHCEINAEQRPYDPRPAHMLTPIKKTVIVTEALRRAIEQGETITVTVVPIITGLTEQCDLENVLKFDQIKLITYG